MSLNLLNTLLPLASRQLDNVSDDDIVTAITLVNNWTVSALEGNFDECESILTEAKVNDGVRAIARKLYDKCNAVTTDTTL